MDYSFVKFEDNRLDIFSAPKLKEKLFDNTQNNMNIILDLSNCIYCDTSGINAIQSMHNTITNAGGELIITGIDLNVERIIKACRLDSVWKIIPNLKNITSTLQGEFCF